MCETMGYFFHAVYFPIDIENQYLRRKGQFGEKQQHLLKEGRKQKNPKDQQLAAQNLSRTVHNPVNQSARRSDSGGAGSSVGL